MSGLVGIPEDRFSRVAAYVYLLLNDYVSTVYLNLVIKIIRHLRIKTVTVTELELRLKSSHKSGSSQNQTY